VAQSVGRVFGRPFKRFSACLFAGLLLLLTFLLWFGFKDLLFTWELDTLSVRQRLFSLPPRDRSRITPLTLVNYDNKTAASADFQRLFGDPMSRAAPAYAARFLQRAGARSVVFDLSFNGGARDWSGDQALADSMRTSNPAASALFFNTDPDPDLAFERQPPGVRRALAKNAVHVRGLEAFPVYRRSYRYAGLVPPYPQLLASPMRFYAANATLSKSNPGDRTADLTGVSRRWIPFALYGGHVFPTLALGAVLQGEETLRLERDGRLSWGGRHPGSVRLGSDGLPLIKWYGHGVLPNRPIYPEFSLSDVVFSEIALECRENPGLSICRRLRGPPDYLPLSPALFRDRHVLLGMTVPNAGDVHRTIYGPRYFGVYILANTLDNLLHDDFVHPVPWGWNALAFLLLPTLLALAGWRFRSTPILCLLTVTLATGHFLLGVFLYNHLNLWLVVVYPILALLGCFIGLFVYRFLREQKRRRQLRFVFAKYVSPAVMEMIERHPESIRLGGVRREMTFLFSDIRGFTAFSDRNPPEVVQRFLSDYFSMMNGIILHDYRGSINKLIGDAIMAYWGFPLADEDHAFLAVSAALAMRDALRTWREDPSRPSIHIGIGINTGEAVIGHVGSEDFMDFTVIGDAVNVAARLEQLNKEYDASIIISAETYERVKDRIHARPLGRVRLRGKETETEIFEACDRIPPSAS
jgi:adenylate cyclase